MSVLIIEDEPAIAKLLDYTVSQAGYQVTVCLDGLEGYQAAQENQYTCLLVDLMLPGMTGLEIVKNLRQQGIYTPIIVLTAKNNEIDKVMALELGADDYMTKPFSPRELEARLKAVIRRSALTKQGGVSVGQPPHKESVSGDLTLNKSKHEIRLNGEVLDLTKTQFAILAYFIKNQNLTISREQLIDGLEMAELHGDTRSIDVHIGKIREKIEENPKKPRRLKTIRGFGYRLKELDNDESF